MFFYSIYRSNYRQKALAQFSGDRPLLLIQFAGFSCIKKYVYLPYHQFEQFFHISQYHILQQSMKGQKFQGTRIKSYVFMRKIARGSVSQVYQAIDQDSMCVVAIKAFSLRFIKQNPKFDEYLRFDIHVLKNSNNKNILKLIDTFKTENYLFVVMEHCQGGSLGQLLRKTKKLSQEAAVGVIKQMVGGLKSLQQLNIHLIYYSIDGIFIKEGIHKLTSFYQYTFQFYKYLQNSDYCGIKLELAPQILQQKGEFSNAIVWSLGVIFHFLITGTYPYKGINDFDLLRKIKNNKLNLKQFDISLHSQEFIEKSLVVDPKKRITPPQILGLPIFKKYLSKTQILQLKQKQREQIAKKAKQKEREQKYKNYERRYLKSKNYSLFIFRYIRHFAQKIKRIRTSLNPNIILYLLFKSAYHQMKQVELTEQNLQKQEIKSEDQPILQSQHWGSLNQSIEKFLDLLRNQCITYLARINPKTCQQSIFQQLDYSKRPNEQTILQKLKLYWEACAKQLCCMKDIKKQDKMDIIILLKAIKYLQKGGSSANHEELDYIITQMNFEQEEKLLKTRAVQAKEQIGQRNHKSDIKVGQNQVRQAQCGMF